MKSRRRWVRDPARQLGAAGAADRARANLADAIVRAALRRLRPNDHIADPPAFDGQEAYELASMLERVVRSLWLRHGDAMADYQGRVYPDAWLDALPDVGPSIDDPDDEPNSSS